MVIPAGKSLTRHGVVAGVVWADGLDKAVASAAREAARIDEPLTLVHASPPRADGRVDADAVPRQRELLRRAVGVAAAAAPLVSVHTRVSSRKPADALLDASRDATMLVLEPTRRTDPGASLVGSTTHAVLMNINSPVLVARNDAV
jgi:nucleotide-binding universal stress UspA family protein